MEGNIVHKFLNIVKDKLKSNKNTNSSVSEYAFSSEEINDLNKKNKEKILELKQDLFTKELKVKKANEEKDNSTIEPVSPIVLNEEVDSKTEESKVQQDKQSPKTSEINNVQNSNSQEELTKPKEESTSQESFIQLTPEHQKLVMENWNHLNNQQLDKDIMIGKELLNHNYTITYADDALNFIHKIRKDYDIVLCYLIGFNNEKKGIPSKTLFSSKLEDEWQYLNQYIKILEKIRSFKNK